MKKAAAIIFVFVMLISVTGYAQTAKEAIMALKKLQTRCDAGISYRDYSNAVADAKFPVDLYLESPEASSNKDFSDSIKNTLIHYQMASEFWNFSFRQKSGSEIWDKENIAKIIHQAYPDAKKDLCNDDGSNCFYVIGSLLSHVWGEASKELKNASIFYAKMDKSCVSEIDKLKQEIATLQKENAALKAKQKKK